MISDLSGTTIVTLPWNTNPAAWSGTAQTFPSIWRTTDR